MTSPPKVVLAHPGTQHAPRLAAELADRRALYRYWTSLSFACDGWPYRLLSRGPGKVRALLAKRTVPGVSHKQIRNCPWLEVQTSLRRRWLSDDERCYYLRNRTFQRSIPQADINRSDVVVGFDTSSWILAERCLEAGRPFILDQTTTHPGSKQQTLELIRERYPEWSDDTASKSRALCALETREHELATHVVVASTSTKMSLMQAGLGEQQITVNPYGVDLEQFVPQASRNASRPIRFAFVGLVNARKGVPLLLDVWKRLCGSGAELWIVGAVANHVRPLIPALPGLRLLGQKPHAELPAVFQECDAFVFPSFFEGFGLVLLEAMACGLPIIASDATAAPDIVRHPEEGTVIESGNDEMLYSAMRRIIDGPEQLQQMRSAARSRAESFTWRAYGDRWLEILQKCTAKQPAPVRC